MDRSEVRKYQMAQLFLLEYFDEICRKNSIKYFIVFGTLLGAVRHKGYIPWDADIDVAMYRDDYEKIRELLDQPDQFIYYEHYENEKNHISPHAVLRIKGTHVAFANYSLMNYKPQNDGIYIDIFPIDNIEDPNVTEVRQIRKIAILRRLVYYKTALSVKQERSLLKKIGKILFSALLYPFSYKYLNAKIDFLMQKDNKKKTEYVGILTETSGYRKLVFSRDVFGNGRECEFEGHKFRAPEDTDKFLSSVYNDYMKLPPENERWQFVDNTIESVDYGNTSFLDGLDEYLQ